MSPPRIPQRELEKVNGQEDGHYYSTLGFRVLGFIGFRVYSEKISGSRSDRFRV